MRCATPRPPSRADPHEERQHTAAWWPGTHGPIVPGRRTYPGQPDMHVWRTDAAASASCDGRAVDRPRSFRPTSGTGDRDHCQGRRSHVVAAAARPPENRPTARCGPGRPSRGPRATSRRRPRPDPASGPLQPRRAVVRPPPPGAASPVHDRRRVTVLPDRRSPGPASAEESRGRREARPPTRPRRFVPRSPPTTRTTVRLTETTGASRWPSPAVLPTSPGRRA